MDTYDTLYQNGVRLLQEGQPLSVLGISEILCELRPNFAEALSLRARALFEVREFDHVLRIVDAMVSAGTSNVATLIYGMKAAFELGDVQQCISYGELLLLQENKCSVALCYLGKCAELSGDTEKAVQHYQKALRADPFCEEAISALIDRKLLNSNALRAVIDALELPPTAEALRQGYRVRVEVMFGEASRGDEPVSTEGVQKRLVLLLMARKEYEANNLRQALSITTHVLEIDAFDRDGVCQHLAILVDLKATPRIFETAHSLSRGKSRAELAVYAIGCYYYSLANYERAGRYFCRATELDCYFAEAWIAYGHCYAKLEEGEQALSVYRRAMNLFPGLSCCSTYVGMQYSRIHQWPVAMCFLEESLKKAPRDPLVLNEIAVLHVRAQKLPGALHFLRLAYEAIPNHTNPNEHRDCIVFNLATVLRKSGEYEEALHFYNLYAACRPNAGHAHCALGFTHHLMGNLKAAIAHYHTALSIKADSFCTEMLDRALASDFGENAGDARWGVGGSCGSPGTGEVSFATASRTLRSGSTNIGSITTESPHQNVDRSLTF